MASFQAMGGLFVRGLRSVRDSGLLPSELVLRTLSNSNTCWTSNISPFNVVEPSVGVQHRSYVRDVGVRVGCWRGAVRTLSGGGG